MDMPQTFLALPQQLQTLLSLQPPPIFSSVPCFSLSLCRKRMNGEFQTVYALRLRGSQLWFRNPCMAIAKPF
jgi:hypothetical protein